MKKSSFVGGIVFILLLSLAQYVSYLRFLADRQEELSKTTHELNAANERFQSSLRYSLAATKTLSYLVKINGVPTDFDSVARGIIGSDSFIDGLQLTEGGVVTHVYPKADEKLLAGFNVLEDSVRKIDALKAFEKDDLFFAGPYKLIQGGVGVVGRLPIFIKGNFFGFAMVLIKMPTLLKAADIDTTNASIYAYQLSKINSNTKKDEFFLHNPLPKDLNIVVSREILDGDWKLYVWLKNRPHTINIITFSLLGFIVSIVAGLLARQFLKQSEWNEARAIQTAKEIVFNRINDRIVSVDNEWRYTFLNDAALADHPLGRKQTLGKVIWDVHPEMKGTIFWQKYHEAMLTQKVTEVECYYTPMNTWFYLKMYPSSEGLTVLYQDITERKSTQSIIAQKENRFRALIENSTDGLTVIDADGIVVEMSPSGRKILGYDQAEIIGKNRPDLIHPEDLDRVMVAFHEIINDPKTIKILEYRHKMPDGSYKWLECSFHNLLNEPNIKALVLNYREIAERKKNEEQQKLFTAIVNSSDDAIISKTLKGIIITWNHGAETIFGFTADEIIGKHIYAIVPSDYQNEEREIIGKIWKGEFIHHYVTKRITKGGQLIDVSLTISPLRNAQGNIIGASKIMRDISKNKKMEAQLISYAQELERSNKELEQFAYIASHDLQEPLRMVGSYMQLIERKYKGKLDKDADEYIHFAVDGATRMKQLINDLLNYSRLNREKVETMVNLNDVLMEVRTNLSTSLKESKGTIIDADLPVINADQTQMLQLFQNLISNAIKFKREGVAPVIDIRTKKLSDQWLFSIHDNGIGIDTQYADKIFVIFRQLHPKSTYGGTGIGLSIAKKIVERHGGKIWFESELGQGTTFFFTLNSTV